MASTIWLPEIVDNIARFLPPNDIPCIIRLVDRASAAQFRDRIVVRLSLPSPPGTFRQRWATPGATRSLTLRKRRQLVALTAASGDLANLEVALESAGCLPEETMLEAAAAAGQVQACKWLRQRGCPWGKALSAAAGAGEQAMREWLLTHDGTWDVVDAACAAARSGHVGLMERLLLRQPDFSSQPQELLVAAAVGCDLATLQRLHNEWGRPAPQAAPPPSGDSDRLLSATARSPTSDWQAKVEWLEGGGYDGLNSSATCCAAAACPDSLARLTWLRERGYPADGFVVAAAAGAGNLASLEYLLAEGVRLDTVAAYRAVTSAAANGHVAVLQALHAHGCDLAPWRVLTDGAWRGGLPVVAWLVGTFSLDLHDPRFDIFNVIMKGVAGKGDMELLRWLHERGVVMWSSDPYDEVVYGGCEEALEWLAERGCPLKDDDGPLYCIAAANRDLAMLRALRRLGCPWGSRGAVFTEVVARGSSPVAVLSWLLEAGCPADWDAAEAEAGASNNNDRSQTLEWLANARREREGMAAVAQ